MAKIKVGIIGGSGMDDPRLMKNKKEKKVKTPYGNPSSALTVGKIEGVDTVILLVIDSLTQRYITGDVKFDVIVGIESRGFIIGGALSYTLGRGFVPIRKKGKLPSEKITHEYELEYGTDIIEIHSDAIGKGDKVLLIDDLLATGGTALAAAALIEKLGGTVSEMAFIVDLSDVGGRKKVEAKGYKVFALTEFEGD